MSRASPDYRVPHCSYTANPLSGLFIDVRFWVVGCFFVFCFFAPRCSKGLASWMRRSSNWNLDTEEKTKQACKECWTSSLNTQSGFGDFSWRRERACSHIHPGHLALWKHILNVLNIKVLVLLIHEGSCLQQNAFKSALDSSVCSPQWCHWNSNTHMLTNKLFVAAVNLYYCSPVNRRSPSVEKSLL